jgi:hypothetical protein
MTEPDLPRLPLDSPRWSELDHAYGKAAGIPALLRHLESFPPSSPDDEPWFSLWSALAHQGDVYPASFAAVPHVVRALAALAAVKGSSDVAEAALELTPEVAGDFLAWLEDR